jgi:hypothetical protein
MTLFDWLEQITVKKQPASIFSEEDWGSFQPYMVSKFISMNMDYIELANYVQKIPHDQKKYIYTAYCNLIPKRKVWLKWVGKTKKSTTPEAEHIARYYECSLSDAAEYMELLGKTGVTEILLKMGIDNTKPEKNARKPRKTK